MVLTDKIKNVPTNHYISCQYIIDDILRYVALSNQTMYFLYSVDNCCLLESIKESDDDYTFDYFIIQQNAPIESQQCSFVDGDRVVETKTFNKDFRTIKPKKSTERQIINHYTGSNNKKLF